MSAENVKVFIRFRNNTTDGTDAIKFHDGYQVTVKSTAMKEKGQRKADYRFDRIWEGDSRQEEVYDMMGQPLLKNIFDGYNSTLFVYGQTGSGKTYTMFGPDGGKMNKEAEGKEGIVPRVLRELFLRIKDLEKQKPDTTYEVSMSICDIYLEKVRDLLNKDVVKKNSNANNLKVRYDKKIGVYITYPDDRSRLATEVTAASGKEAMTLIDNAIRIRKKTGGQAKTKMNEFSSRSHLVISCKLVEKSPAGIKTSKLLLCDLAGSEKTRNTGSVGIQLKQAQNINYGLSMLGNVLNALTDKKRVREGKNVPFRDSKLTAILQDSLGGNCKTALICTCRPDDKFYAETRSTLRFGNNAKKIKNEVRKNETLTVAQYKARMKLYERRIHNFEENLAVAEQRIELQTTWSKALEERFEGDIDEFAKQHNLMTSKQIERRFTVVQNNQDDQKDGDHFGIAPGLLGMGRRATFGGGMFGSLGDLSEASTRATTPAQRRMNAKLQCDLEEAQHDIQDLRAQLRASNEYCEQLESQNYDYSEMERDWQETETQLKEQQGLNYQYKEEMKNLKDKLRYLEQHNKQWRDGTQQSRIDLVENARASSFATSLAESQRELKRVQKAFEEGRCDDVVLLVTDLVEQTKEIKKLKKALAESNNHTKSLHALQDRERETRSKNESEILEVWTKYKHEKTKWDTQEGQFKYRIEMLEKQVEELREARDNSQEQLRRAEGKMPTSEIKRALTNNPKDFFKFLRASNLERKLTGKNVRRVPKRRKKRPQTEGHQLRLSLEDILGSDDQLALEAGIVSPTA